MDKQIRLTYKQVETGIAQTLGVMPSALKYHRLTEEPNRWRHACKRTGVVETKPTTIYPYGIQLDYLVCPYCGSVLYYLHQG